jgi:hypothetical protein
VGAGIGPVILSGAMDDPCASLAEALKRFGCCCFRHRSRGWFNMAALASSLKQSGLKSSCMNPCLVFSLLAKDSMLIVAATLLTGDFVCRDAAALALPLMCNSMYARCSEEPYFSHCTMR